MRYLAVLLLSSTLLACTTTQGTSSRVNTSSSMTVDNLSDADKLSYQMGFQYIERGEYAAAEEKLLPLVKKYPNFTNLYVLLGLNQELQGKNSDAIALYSKAIAIDPTDRTGIKHYVKLQCDPYDKSAAVKMASIADSSPQELKAGMSSGAAACYLIHGDYNQANQYANKGIAANPNYADTYYFKAMAADKLKQYNEVFPALDRYHNQYGYEPASVRLGLESAQKARNQSEIAKYEKALANQQSNQY